MQHCSYSPCRASAGSAVPFLVAWPRTYAPAPASLAAVIAYTIAALSSSLDIANATVPTVLSVMLFLSGFLIRCV